MRSDPRLAPEARSPDSAQTRLMRIPEHGLLVVTGLAALLIVATGGCIAPPAPPGTPASTQAQPPADPQVADAIQQVIQRANAEQAQAIATQDPSVISDTATGSYYSELQQTYRDLLSQGATSIQLTNLMWGSITAGDTTARANTTETWVTAYSDDTTDQSTDANVYAGEPGRQLADPG